MSSARLTPAQFAAAKALFDSLVDLPPAQQHSALDDASLEPVVRDEVRRLLDHTASGFDGAAIYAAVARMAEGPASGASLGAWKLVEEIGAGGMGKVFRAERNDGHFQQQAAVKLLGGMPSATALRHLTRERQILASLAHPNIARLLDGGSTDTGQPYLVMEYVAGLPILDYCRAPATAAGRVRRGRFRPRATGGSLRPQARQHPGHRERTADAAGFRHLAPADRLRAR